MWSNVIHDRDEKLVSWKAFRKRYYKHNPVLFEMLKTLRGRETAFLGASSHGASPVRCVKAHQVGYLESNFKSYNFYNRPYNVYISLAKLNNMPLFSFAPKIRRGQQDVFNIEFKKYMYDYDLAFDFEAKCSMKFGNIEDANELAGSLRENDIPFEFTPSKRGFHVTIPETRKNDIFKLCRSQVERLKNSLDDYNVPYVLKWSGGGYHIRIMGNYLPKVTKWEERLEYCKMFALNVKQVFNLTTLDITIYDMRRVFKAPYSIDIKSDLVALPLDNDNFNFLSSYSDMEKFCDPRVILMRTDIRNRGLLERKGTKENLTKYFDEIIK